jgi:hypothetical protein
MGPRGDAANALASLFDLDLINSTARADHSEHGDGFLVPTADIAGAWRQGCAPVEQDRAALALAALGASTTVEATLADVILHASINADPSHQNALITPSSGTALHGGLLWKAASGADEGRDRL